MAEKKWMVDGFDLDTLAYRVEEVPTGLGLPGRKGENINVPYAHGARYVPKKPLDERVITLSMWVKGTPSDGVRVVIDPGPPVIYEDRKITLQRNLDNLLQLFGQERLLNVSRKMADGSIRTIQAECKNPLHYVHMRTGEVRFAVDLLAPDPLFYGSLVEIAYPLTLVEHAVTLQNPGTATTRRLEIVVEGATAGLKIENTTTGTWVRYGNTTLATETLTITSPQNEAVRQLVDGEPENRVGLISHAGDPSFLVVAPGENALVITTESAPAATLTIKFLRPYF